MERVLYVVMAGGRGDRLRPLTDGCPKPLVRFGPAGRIIDFTLYNAFCSGFGDVLVLTQYRGDMLERYLTLHWAPAFQALGRDLEILPGHKSLKGKYLDTADAVYQALAGRLELPWYVVVLAGDHVYRMDYRAMVRAHQAGNRTATVAAALTRREDCSRFGIIETDEADRIVRFHEKPGSLAGIVPRGRQPLASMGIYVFTTASLMSYLEENQSGSSHDFGKDILPLMAERRDAQVHRFLRADGRAGYWRDVGDLPSYWRTHLELLEGRARELYFDPAPGLGKPPFSIGHLVRWEERAGRTIENSLLSEHCRVGSSRVKDSVICPGAVIEDAAVVMRSVVLDGAVVRSGAEVISSVVDTMAEVRPDWKVRDVRGPLDVRVPVGIHPMSPIRLVRHHGRAAKLGGRELQ